MQNMTISETPKTSSSFHDRLATALALTAAVFALTPAVGCGAIGGPGGEAPLPPLSALFIPSPAQDRASSSTAQAACSTGTSAYETTIAVIDRENEALAGDRALIDELLAASPESEGAIVAYEAEVDGRSLRVEVISGSAGEVAFTGTLTDEDGEHDYLSGAMANSQEDGALVITPPGGNDLEVAWSTSAGTHQFARVQGESTTAFDDSDDSVRVVSGETIISWEKSDYTGTVIDGGSVQCFEGGAQADDFCDVTCSGDELADLYGTDF